MFFLFYLVFFLGSGFVLFRYGFLPLGFIGLVFFVPVLFLFVALVQGFIFGFILVLFKFEFYFGFYFGSSFISGFILVPVLFWVSFLVLF